MTTTSTLARDQHEASGTTEDHRNRVRVAIAELGEGTSTEIGRACGLTSEAAGRRLSELADDFHEIHRDGSRRCTIKTRRTMTVWKHGPKPSAQLEMFE